MDKLLSAGRKIWNTIETGKISAPACVGAVAGLAKGFQVQVHLGNMGSAKLTWFPQDARLLVHGGACTSPGGRNRKQCFKTHLSEVTRGILQDECWAECIWGHSPEDCAPGGQLPENLRTRFLS